MSELGEMERIAVALERIVDCLEPVVEAVLHPRLMVGHRVLDEGRRAYEMQLWAQGGEPPELSDE